MATPASDGLHLWTECFTKMGAHNRALFESFMGAANQETLDFLHRRIQQRSELAERIRHTVTEITSAQQDFAKTAINDWVEHAHKLNQLYWHTVEDRMEQASQTVASVVPFAPKVETNNRRKAA
jgi:hypothetical protein